MINIPNYSLNRLILFRYFNFYFFYLFLCSIDLRSILVEKQKIKDCYFQIGYPYWMPALCPFTKKEPSERMAYTELNTVYCWANKHPTLKMINSEFLTHHNYNFCSIDFSIMYSEKPGLVLLSYYFLEFGFFHSVICYLFCCAILLFMTISDSY